jgi:hypothetical protein
MTARRDVVNLENREAQGAADGKQPGTSSVALNQRWTSGLEVTSTRWPELLVAQVTRVALNLEAADGPRLNQIDKHLYRS